MVEDVYLPFKTGRETEAGEGGGAGGSFWARHMSKTRRLLHDIILQTERRTTAFVNQLNLSELIRNCRFIAAAVFAAAVALLSRFMHRYEPLSFFFVRVKLINFRRNKNEC